jgi:hypothetical protein
MTQQNPSSDVHFSVFNCWLWSIWTKLISVIPCKFCEFRSSSTIFLLLRDGDGTGWIFSILVDEELSVAGSWMSFFSSGKKLKSKNS